jgi:tRNA modification GTPase
VVLAGEPNAGKSSLLNALAQRDTAIVTDVPGTTRDVLRENIVLNGVPLHVVDTAGLRKTVDIIEQEGIKRAQNEIQKADIVLWVSDSTKQNDFSYIQDIPKNKLIIVHNKMDLPKSEQVNSPDHVDDVYISATTRQGFDELSEKIFKKIGLEKFSTDQFSARGRHIHLLNQALEMLNQGSYVLTELKAGELLAEHLRSAHQLLGEMTGEFTSDDLLGEIFSKFCIGK